MNGIPIIGHKYNGPARMFDYGIDSNGQEQIIQLENGVRKTLSIKEFEDQIENARRKMNKK